MKRLLRSFLYAFSGIAQAIKTQRSMRIHLFAAVFAIIMGLVTRLTPVEWAIIILLIGLVLAFECLNTTIEATLDRQSTEYHPLTRIAKDAAAGAVLIMAITSVAVGLIIYINALLRLLGW